MARRGFWEQVATALEGVRRAWGRLPERVRGAALPAAALVVAVTYPLYQANLPTNVPVIERFPGVDTGVVMIVFAMMAVGLNIVVGYAGLLDLGYVAFYASGAYFAAWFASQQFAQVTFHFGAVGIDPSLSGIHVSIWLLLIGAGLFTGLLGALIGLPTLRLRGDYLAIVTLGFGEIIPQFVLNGDNVGGFDLTNGTFGITPIDAPGFGTTLNDSVSLPENFRTSIHSERLFFWAALALLLFTIFCSIRLRDSRLGRAWIAIREDETAAAAMGIPLMRTKTWAYAIGAFFGGIAGAYYASFKSGAFPSEFFFNISIFILCMVILGGMGSVWGPIIGGMVLTWLNQEALGNIGDWFSSTSGINVDVPKYQFGIYGAIIVLVMLFRPTGLITEKRRKQELEEGVHDEALYEATHT